MAPVARGYQVMGGKKTVDEAASDKTMTVEAILEKAEWLKGQAAKNRELQRELRERCRIFSSAYESRNN